ncbi:MAG: hypothetical protein WD696_18905 [Bryobacteraceae bacterium]
MPNLEPDGRGLTPEAVRSQLDRILASEGFANSDRLSRFLRFAVEAKLRGEEDQIKEYVVGREVFDRGDNYDPRLDPIVRVEARRLRAKLDEYYAGPGREDALRIGFRKGSYVPVIEPAVAEPERPGSPSTRTPRRVAAAALFLVAASGGLSYLSREPSGYRVAVAPAHWLGWNSVEPSAFEESLVEAVTAELAHRPSLQVISWPSMLHYRNARRPLREVAEELRAALVLVVSVESFGDEVRVTLHLVEAASDRKMWSADYTRNFNDALAAQRELARVIAEELEAYRRGRG